MKQSGAGSSAWVLRLSAAGSQAGFALAVRDVVHHVPVLRGVLFLYTPAYSVGESVADPFFDQAGNGQVCL